MTERLMRLAFIWAAASSRPSQLISDSPSVRMYNSLFGYLAKFACPSRVSIPRIAAVNAVRGKT